MAQSARLQAIFARTDDPPAADGEPADDQADGTTNGGGRGALRPNKARKVRGLVAGEKPRDCKLTTPKSVFERLRQTALKREKTMSVVAGEILHRNLPYFDVIQKDKPPDAGDVAGH
jgi:hypothetical protein